jgi:hypothetical protein
VHLREVEQKTRVGGIVTHDLSRVVAKATDVVSSVSGENRARHDVVAMGVGVSV